MGLGNFIYNEIRKKGTAGAQRLLKQLSGGAQNLGRNAENVIMGGPLPLATPTPNPRRLFARCATSVTDSNSCRYSTRGSNTTNRAYS